MKKLWTMHNRRWTKSFHYSDVTNLLEINGGLEHRYSCIVWFPALSVSSLKMIFLQNRSLLCSICSPAYSSLLVRVDCVVYTHPFRLRGRIERWHTGLFTLSTCQTTTFNCAHLGVNARAHL